MQFFQGGVGIVGTVLCYSVTLCHVQATLAVPMVIVEPKILKHNECCEIYGSEPPSVHCQWRHAFEKLHGSEHLQLPVPVHKYIASQLWQ